MKVVIDSRETRRIETATEFYEKKGLDVSVEELPVGDYVFSNGENEVVFEYKKMTDFFSSIQDNRVFNQSISQSEEFDFHFVLIHGNLYDRNNCIALSRRWQPVNVYQYLGAIASLNRYTTVIECDNDEIDEVYYRMLVTAQKSLQDKPVVKKFGRKHKNPAFNWLCYCNYGISAKKAQAIIDTLQLETLDDLINLTVEDLVSVDGIGKKTAKNIINGIK